MGFIDRLLYTEKLLIQQDDVEAETTRPAAKTANELKCDTSLVRLLRNAVEMTSDDDDWAHMGKVGRYILNNSSFSAVNYGYKKLGDLIRATELFDEEIRGKSTMYIKDARKKK